MVQVQGYSEDDVEILSAQLAAIINASLQSAVAKTAAGLKPALTASGIAFHLPGKHDQHSHGARSRGVAIGDFWGKHKEEAAEGVWGGQFGDFTSKTDWVIANGTPEHGVVTVSGSVYGADGYIVGSWTRSIHTEPGKPTYVKHESLQLKPSAQRHGFATDFNEQAYATYRDPKMGIDHVKVDAVNRGRVSWALAGFEFASEGDARATTKAWMTEAKARVPEGHPLRGQLDALEARFTGGSYGSTSGWPTAYELVTFGRGPGDKSWVGADAMMAHDMTYSGVLLMSDFS